MMRSLKDSAITPRHHGRPYTVRPRVGPVASVFLVAAGILLCAASLLRAQGARKPDSTRVAVLAAGDSAWDARDDRRALAIYRTLYQRDSTSVPRVGARLANLLARGGRYADALRIYHQYLQLVPGDDDARLGLAQTLAWSGRYDESLAAYQRVTQRDPLSLDARKGVARVLAWQGKLGESERHWRELAADHASDAEVWAGLGQVLRWEGQLSAAQDALRRALATNPGDVEAADELQRVRATTDPAVRPTANYLADSDHNAVTTYGTVAEWPVGERWLIGGSLEDREARLRALSARAVTGALTGSWSPADSRWSLRATTGVATSSTPGIPSAGVAPVRHVTPLTSATVITQIGSAARLGVGVSTGPFFDTAPLIADGLTSDEVSGGYAVQLPDAFALDLDGSYSAVRHGVRDNHRRGMAATLRWLASPGLSIAATGRGFGYDSSTFEGYFAPTSYLLGEMSVRARAGGDRGWAGSLEVAGGREQFAFSGDSPSGHFAGRAQLEVLYRLFPGDEVRLMVGTTNLASAAQAQRAGYHATTIALGARVRL